MINLGEKKEHPSDMPKCLFLLATVLSMMDFVQSEKTVGKHILRAAHRTAIANAATFGKGKPAATLRMTFRIRPRTHTLASDRV